nr:uncharacterized protein LOC128690685 [Cherax quadricarinatus]
MIINEKDTRNSQQVFNCDRQGLSGNPRRTYITEGFKSKVAVVDEIVSLGKSMGKEVDEDVNELISVHSQELGDGVLQHHEVLKDIRIVEGNVYKSHLEWFTGCLTGEGVELLRQCHQLRWLHLAVVKDHLDGCLLQKLHATVMSTLHQLKYLTVRVSAAVSADALTSLPSTHKAVMLELTDMSDDKVSHACTVAQELQPPEGYWMIRCESKTVTVEGIQNMIQVLHNNNVKVNHELSVVTRVTVKMKERHHLVTLARTTLGCRLTTSDKSVG